MSRLAHFAKNTLRTVTHANQGAASVAARIISHGSNRPFSSVASTFNPSYLDRRQAERYKDLQQIDKQKNDVHFTMVKKAIADGYSETVATILQVSHFTLKQRENLLKEAFIVTPDLHEEDRLHTIIAILDHDSRQAEQIDKGIKLDFFTPSYGRLRRPEEKSEFVQIIPKKAYSVIYASIEDGKLYARSDEQRRDIDAIYKQMKEGKSFKEATIAAMEITPPKDPGLSYDKIIKTLNQAPKRGLQLQ